MLRAIVRVWLRGQELRRLVFAIILAAAIPALAAWTPAARAASEARSGAPADSGRVAADVRGTDDERLRVLRRDIETLRHGIDTLAGKEQGVLGDLKILEADALRKQADLAQAEANLERTEKDASERAVRAADLGRRVAQMRAEVAQRVAALYRLGRPRYLRVLLASQRPADLLSAYRTAAALSSRDAQIISRYRSEQALARSEAARLAELQPVLVRERELKSRAALEAERAFEKKRDLLRAVQTDRRTHEATLSELETATRSVGRLIAGLTAPAVSTPGFDRLRGLLDWPSQGAVSSPFGRSVNRKFGTALAHNGLDIDAPFGSEIRSIYDGTVVFAQWLRGYGLTVIVDHGGGWISVYAHASVLLVSKGERVGRSRKIALVGDTASLNGPYLYFEVRKDGLPVNPQAWLRPR